MIRSTFVAICLGLAVGAAHSFDLNDCIINGMKGVSSDAAARQVRYACDQKHKAFKQERIEQLLKEFGEPLDVEVIEAGKYYEVEEPGFYSTQYSNKSNEKTVTFIRLEVVPAPGGAGTSCDFTKRRVHAYKVTLKPRAAMKLVYPSPYPSNCVNALAVLGRAPSWMDVSLSSAARPSNKDPFAGLD